MCVSEYSRRLSGKSNKPTNILIEVAAEKAVAKKKEKRKKKKKKTRRYPWIGVYRSPEFWNDHGQKNRAQT